MIVKMYCKDGYEIANDEFRDVEIVVEKQMNCGTFWEVVKAGGETHSLTAKHIKRLVIEMEKDEEE